MRSNGINHLTFTIFCSVLLLTTSTQTADADVIILESNAPGLKSGQVLKNDAKITIPLGKRAQLILPSGKTRTIKGPFDGTATDLTKGEKSDSSLFNRLLDVVKKSGRDDSGFAAVRRVGRAAPSIGFSWTTIPADTTGTFCFAEGEELKLMRPRNISINTLTLRNTDTNRAETITWKKGQKSATWPEGLLPGDKSRFGFKLGERNERPVTLRQVARAAQNNDDVLRTLHHRGCQKQLEAWLRTRLRR